MSLQKKKKRVNQPEVQYYQIRDDKITALKSKPGPTMKYPKERMIDFPNFSQAELRSELFIGLYTNGIYKIDFNWRFQDDKIPADGEQAGSDEAGQILQPDDCEGENNPRRRAGEEMPVEEWVIMSLHLVQVWVSQRRGYKVVYRRYAALYFIVGLDIN